MIKAGDAKNRSKEEPLVLLAQREQLIKDKALRIKERKKIEQAIFLASGKGKTEILREEIWTSTIRWLKRNGYNVKKEMREVPLYPEFFPKLLPQTENVERFVISW
jgi:hypothetical protein